MLIKPVMYEYLCVMNKAGIGLMINIMRTPTINLHICERNKDM
ncbi:Group-specific protein [Bacillus cereus]|nr:Group-specific protein [Bacillus cereus]